MLRIEKRIVAGLNYLIGGSCNVFLYDIKEEILLTIIFYKNKKYRPGVVFGTECPET